MRLIVRAVPALLLSVLAGCASRGDMDNVQRNMEEMKTRIFMLDKDISGMRSETKEGIDSTIKDFHKNMDTLRKGAADLQATLDSARVDMQALAGKIDDVRILAQKPADDIALLREDTTRKLAALEERLTAQDKAIAEIQGKLAEMKTALIEKRPEDLYQKAQDVLKSGDKAKAKELFARLIELYPKHQLAAEAHFQLGESYFNEKNYDQAILEFQEIIKNFPDGERAPAAMLMQAMSFNELGDVKSAKFVLKKLIENYPNSPESKTAADKLKELK